MLRGRKIGQKKNGIGDSGSGGTKRSDEADDGDM